MFATLRTPGLILLTVALLGCEGASDVVPVATNQPTQRAEAPQGSRPTEPPGDGASQASLSLPPVLVKGDQATGEQAAGDQPTGDQAASATKQKPKQELFVGWPKPQAALVISGNQHGYIEPCGCTGLANQKGGLARRHTLIKQLASRGWNVVPVDAGNQVRRFGRQAEIQFQLTAEALKKMNYQAIGLGHEDLLLSAGEVVAAVASDDGTGPFVSANAAVLDRGLVPQALVVEAGGRKIGITSVLGDEFRKKVTAEEVVLDDAETGLQAALPQFEEAACDYRVLLAFASVEEARALAKKYKVFDLVVASSGPSEPSFEPEPIEGTNGLLVHSGVKGMYVCVVGLYDDSQQPIRYERVPLDDRFRDSPEMLDLLAGYQNQLQELGWEGLGLRSLRHASGRSFVGTQVCGECHTQALAVWEKTAHAHATESLIHPGERAEIPRHFDPECLSCHVTGWEPQKYFPFTSGYLGVNETPEMLHNGCENCHGPGSEHVAAENNEGSKYNAKLVEKLRGEMRLPLANDVARNKCVECHDIDNSPDFHAPGAFEKYWKEVAHEGKD
jgi:hypothetical protein